MLPYYTFQPPVSDRRWMHCKEIAPNCPRCDSSNTKFCYYNNYSFSQPRYFCKGCRRYWTKGGSIRNIPVRSGCRRSRRPKPARLSSPSSPPSTISRQHDQASFRPDHALQGMTRSPAADGSSIDLALLYAKFLNKCPKEPLDRSALGSCSSSIEQVAPAPELMSSFGAVMGCHSSAELSEVTTLLHVEQSGCESMEFLMDEGVGSHDLFSSGFHRLASDTLCNNTRTQVSGSELGGGIYPQENLLVEDWNTFDPSSEAFYKF